MASSQVEPVAVSIARPSRHQPTFEYDQKCVRGTFLSISISVASREIAASSASGWPAKPNSSRSRNGSPERLARRSRRVERSAQPPPRTSGTCTATGSSSDSRPACASRATTVDTIDLVSEATLKAVSEVIGSPVVTSATP